MNKRIIYTTPEGTLAIIIPSQEALALHSIQAIALKDVPAGLPFKIVDAASIPSDRLFRAAWEVDAASLTDGVGAESNEFPEVAA